MLGLSEIVIKNPPDKLWLVQMIGHVKGDHPIFAKGYVAPRRSKVARMIELDNSDGFYTGLPELEARGGKRRRMAMPKSV